jgi:hypothetical protein
MTTHAEPPAPVVSALRVLGAADLVAAAEHLASDPVGNVFAAARI